MATARTFRWLVIADVTALLAIYLPFAFRPLEALEILAPAFLNVYLLLACIVVCCVVSLIPATRRFAGAGWLGFGLLLLMSVPAFFATAYVNLALIS